MTPAEQRTAAKNFAYDWLSRKGRKTKAASAQAASTKRIFGTRANELSKIPYFRGFTTCIHGLEVML